MSRTVLLLAAVIFLVLQPSVAFSLRGRCLNGVFPGLLRHDLSRACPLRLDGFPRRVGPRGQSRTSMQAGIVDKVMKMNWNVIGTVAQPTFGAIEAPMIDETENTKTIWVWPSA